MRTRGVKNPLLLLDGHLHVSASNSFACQILQYRRGRPRVILLIVAVLALCLPGAAGLSQQEDAEPGAGTQSLKGALLVTARRLEDACREAPQSVVMSPEDVSVLDGYAAVMLAFFVRESGVNARLVRAAGISPSSLPLPEGIPPERLGGLRASGASVALAVRVSPADETSGTLEAAAYSLQDGARIAACQLEFEFSDGLSFLGRAERLKLPASDGEWLELFEQVFPPLELPAEFDRKLAWTEGEYFFGSGLWEQAAQRLSGLDSKGQDRCLLHLAFSLQQVGRVADALGYVENALKLRPDSGPLYALRAWLVLRSGRAEDALMLLEQARICGLHKEGFYWLARFLLAVERKEDDIAEQFLVKGAELLPDEPFAQVKAAQYYWRKANLEMAAKFYRRALAAGDATAETWVELGMTLDASGEREQALDAFQRAFEIEPGNVSAARYLSSLLRSRGEHEQALEVLRKSSEAWPDRVELLAAYGDAAAQMWRTAEAQAAYEQALRHDPQFHYVKVGLARMLARQRRYAEAQKLLSDLLKAQPDYQPARIALGRLLAELGDTRQSVEVLESAAKSPNYEVAARLAIADVQCRIGKYADAADNARIAVTARPDAEGYAMLARAFVGLSDWENAKTAVERALEAAPGDPAAHVAAARRAEARGEREGAMAELRQALELDPYLVEAMAFAGRVCLEMDNPAGCAEFWRRAVALDRWDAGLHWELAELLRTRLEDPRGAVEHYLRHVELGGARAPEAARIIEELRAALPQG